MTEKQLLLIEQYIDGTLREEDAEEFKRLLLASPAARTKLRTLATVEFGLQDLAAGAPWSNSSDIARLDKSSEALRDSSRNKWIGYSLVASVAALAASLAWVFLGGIEKSPECPAIAHLTYVSKAQWSKPRAVGSAVGVETLKLDSGLAKLDFSNGTCVTLEGPAVFEIVSPMQTLLHAGVLTAHVPEAAIGFRVDTPTLEVIDQGTAFGVSVSEDGLTNVSVFEGKVDVNPKVKHAHRGSRKRITEGQAIQVARNSSMIESIETDTERYEQSWPINSGVLQTMGPLKFVSPGPSFVPGRYEDNEFIVVFPERRDLLLESPIPVDLMEPGEYIRNRKQPSLTLPAGHRVRSYLVQLNLTRRAKANVVGQITFDRPILGLAAQAATLTQTDSTLGHPNGVYDAEHRGVEVAKVPGDSSHDNLIVSADRRTLIFSLAKGSGLDQIRVIVDDVEQPNAL